MSNFTEETIENYQSSTGLKRLYYYVVLWCTVGDVATVVREYNKRPTSFTSYRVVTPTYTGRPFSSVSSHCGYVAPKREETSYADEWLKAEEDDENDLLTTAAILGVAEILTSTNEDNNTSDWSVSDSSSDDSFDFGGGGDADGGGAGGDW